MEQRHLSSDNFVVAEGLSKKPDIIWEVQTWFNELVELYNEEIHRWTLVLHRSLVVWILWHDNTRDIAPCRWPVRWGRKSYNIKGRNGRDYYIILHADDDIPGGYITQWNLIQALGNSSFQERWIKLINKVRRGWFLDYMLLDTRNKLTKILSHMSTSDRSDIEKALLSLKT